MRGARHKYVGFAAGMASAVTIVELD